MKLYLNKAGSLEGVRHGATVFAWVLISGAVTAGAQYISTLHVDPKNYILVGVVAFANAFLSGVVRWVSTKR